MAAGVKLVMKFGTAEAGVNTTFSYNYANRAADEEDVKALVAGMIANGAIFENVPVTAISAKTVITTENEYDLSA